jgi:glycosyltransferase involved in cell wall biosynthesis
MSMLPNCPFVSIIVPVYNGENTVKSCIESLLGQNYPDDRFEIITVDNKSKDRTLDILKSYSEKGVILLLKETNILNAYGARNTGIKAAKGEIIAFTDSDDVTDPNWIQELVNGFSDKEIGCVAGSYLLNSPKNVIEKYSTINSFKTETNNPDRIFGGNCAFRSHIIDLIGVYNTIIPSGGDTELAKRMQEKTKYRIFINDRAIVHHKNVDNLKSFVKQNMRYGTQKYNLNKQNPKWKEIKNFLHLIFITIEYFGSFFKKLIFVLLGLARNREEDTDIFILRPLLRIISEWSLFIGYHFAVSNQNIVR